VTLVAHHYVASIGLEHQTIRRDLTPAQLRYGRSYHEGDVLYFRRGSKRRQIPKGAYLMVSAVNETSLTLAGETGADSNSIPARSRQLRPTVPNRAPSRSGTASNGESRTTLAA
jgi:hypothetical protein